MAKAGARLWRVTYDIELFYKAHATGVRQH